MNDNRSDELHKSKQTAKIEQMSEKIPDPETPEEKQRRIDELAAKKYDEQRGQLRGGTEVTHYTIHDYLTARRGKKPQEPGESTSGTEPVE